MSYARFQVYRDKNGKYRFLLRDPQNQVVTVSEPCDTKDECIEDIKAIKQYHTAPIEDLVKTEPRPPQKPREASVIRPTTLPSLILHDPIQALEHEYVIRGADVTFRGQLRVGDQGIAGALINVYDSDRSFLRDDVLVSGITQPDGTFRMTWKATSVDWFDTLENVYDTVEVYAKFEGNAKYKPAVSKQYTFFVREKAYF